MVARLIRVRYAGSCVACDATVPARTDAWWDAAAKTLRCPTCGGSAWEAPHGAAAVTDRAAAARAARRVFSPVPAPADVAGRSAQREYDRRHTRREEGIRARHPHLGGLLLATSSDPQSTTTWAKGAEGERRVGAVLDRLADVRALHDRLIPGSRANIDHLAVGPTGVWVIDAKRYTGQVTRKNVGGLFKADVRLYVGRRDCTKLVSGMARQVAAVRSALGVDWSQVPVRPLLCFVDAEWSLFAKPFRLEGVTVAWPKETAKLVGGDGPFTPEGVAMIAGHLDTRLRHA